MGEVFKHFIDLIKDKTTSWGFKTALFISIIALLFVADYYIGFSNNYHLNNKIIQLEKINTLKSKYKNDSLAFEELNKMELKIFTRKHYSEELINLFQKDSVSNKPIIIGEKSVNHRTSSKLNRSVFWMSLSSNYLLAIILPFLVFLPLYSKDGRKASALVGWFASLIMIGIVGLITTWVSFQIPLIFNNPLWNYILNFLIHTLFWVVTVKLSNNKNTITT